MVSPNTLLQAWLLLLAGERGVELWLSARNTRRALAAGGAEAGRGHYPAMVLLHAAFFPACVLEPLLWPRPWPGLLALAAFGVALLAMVLRWWAIASLGERWSTRIVVWPGRALVRAGPYRLLTHPNYLAVVLELLAVPLIGGAVVTATVGTIANLVLLAFRIRAEEQALGLRPRFGSAPRGAP
jgi:methyltransferase